MSLSLTISIMSAVFAMLGLAISWSMYRLAVKGQQRAFEQWLAVNEPWLRVSFEHAMDEDMKNCFMRGFPSFIRLQNQGNVPCIIEWAKLGDEVLHARIRKSSISDTSLGGTIEGARLIPGETLYLKFSRAESIIHRVLGGTDPDRLKPRYVVPLQISYRYEPERRKLLKVNVRLIANGKWALLRVLDSSLDCQSVHPANKAY